jgi:putative ABC transport system permease protein
MNLTGKALLFAGRNLLRQPGRAAVGILGIAAVGALLFDMLLLSRGLVVSFRDLLDGVGFDVRVLASDAAPLGGPRLPDAPMVVRQLAALPEVDEAMMVRFVDASVDETPGHELVDFSMTAIDLGKRRPWTVKAGRDLDASAGTAILLNPRLAEALHAQPGDTLSVRVSCVAERAALAPVPFRVSGIADFPFDDATWLGGAASSDAVMAACGGGAVPADMILIASRESYGADAAVAAIRRTRPDLHPVTNEEIVTRMQQQGFTYFRQISAVLSTITMVFGFLLISVLLTVSVNQRLGEIAALRALGFSRARVAADVFWQSALLVGIGGTLALPLAFILALWLDRILKAMPQIPATLHFFVFEPQALVWQAILLIVTAVLAALYPMRLVVRLPISATLRNEVIG